MYMSVFTYRHMHCNATRGGYDCECWTMLTYWPGEVRKREQANNQTVCKECERMHILCCCYYYRQSWLRLGIRSQVILPILPCGVWSFWSICKCAVYNLIRIMDATPKFCFIFGGFSEMGIRYILSLTQFFFCFAFRCRTRESSVFVVKESITSWTVAKANKTDVGISSTHSKCISVGFHQLEATTHRYVHSYF